MRPPLALALALAVGAPSLYTLPAAAAPPGRSLFQRVIPAPTGKNGYEELVLAGEVLKSSALFQKSQSGEAAVSLAEKRRVLADRPVQRALLLMRQAFSKPIHSPREKITFDTELPELTEFRNLARMLKMRQYVLLADGRTAEAVTDARLCLKLGQAVQRDHLIGGLVGVAISSNCVKVLGAHLDQLSSRDCERLYDICLEWLNQPDPVPGLIEGEQRGILEAINRISAGLRTGDTSQLKVLGLDEKDTRDAAAFAKGLPPDQVDALAAQARRKTDEHFRRVFEELRKPAWQRDPSRYEAADEGTPDSVFLRLFAPALNKATDAFTRESAHMRILAVHCAIRRFRWEHDRLPPDLSALNLGALAVDPFNGQPLQYEAQGRSYRLTSVGNPVEDNPKAVGGRLPVGITPDD